MLTKTKLKAMQLKAKPYRVADSNGLCIEVRHTGTKVWRYRYRHTGHASMITLGEYPAMSLDEARSERDKMRVLVRNGANPAQVTQAERAARAGRSKSTFASLGFEFLAKREKEGMGADSVRRGRRLIEKDLASIGSFPVAEVPAPMLLKALRKMEERRIVESAHRARGLASQIFLYAIATGRADRNPAADLVGALQSHRTKHFASILDPSKIGELLRAIDCYQGSIVVLSALKLAPMLFVRPGELRQAEWAEIDLENRTWAIPASKMKMKLPHIVPLSHQAAAVLLDLNPLTGRDKYVFPSMRAKTRPMSENTINAALKTLGYSGDVITSHGFRAMARTLIEEELGIPAEHIEHQLAHAVRGPNGRAYNRTTHLLQRRKMMQAWADYLDSLKRL